MLLVMRLKRHTVLVILEFRVNQGSLESELVKLLHFLEELDSLFLYITWEAHRSNKDQSATALVSLFWLLRQIEKPIQLGHRSEQLD